MKMYNNKNYREMVLILEISIRRYMKSNPTCDHAVPIQALQDVADALMDGRRLGKAVSAELFGSSLLSED